MTVRGLKPTATFMAPLTRCGCVAQRRLTVAVDLGPRKTNRGVHGTADAVRLRGAATVGGRLDLGPRKTNRRGTSVCRVATPDSASEFTKGIQKLLTSSPARISALRRRRLLDCS